MSRRAGAVSQAAALPTPSSGDRGVVSQPAQGRPPSYASLRASSAEHHSREGARGLWAAEVQGFCANVSSACPRALRPQTVPNSGASGKSDSPEVSGPW